MAVNRNHEYNMKINSLFESKFCYCLRNKYTGATEGHVGLSPFNARFGYPPLRHLIRQSLLFIILTNLTLVLRLTKPLNLPSKVGTKTSNLTSSAKRMSR